MPSLLTDEIIARLASKRPEELTEEEKRILREWLIRTRGKRSFAQDIRWQAKNVPPTVGVWLRRPNRYDIPGVDTPDVREKEIGKRKEARVEPEREELKKIAEYYLREAEGYEEAGALKQAMKLRERAKYLLEVAEKEPIDVVKRVLEYELKELGEKEAARIQRLAEAYLAHLGVAAEELRKAGVHTTSEELIKPSR